MSAAPSRHRAPPRRGGDDAPALALDRAPRAVVAWALAVAALCAGMGWLYVLRHAGALSHGSRLAGALPLQQLNGDADQPLARVLVAWLPAGLAAGGVLAVLTRLGVGARTLAVLVLAALVLAISGAISNAVALNEPVRPHLADQFTRAGFLVELGCVVVGSLLVPVRPATGRRPARRAGQRG